MGYHVMSVCCGTSYMDVCAAMSCYVHVMSFPGVLMRLSMLYFVCFCMSVCLCVYLFVCVCVF